MFPNTGSLARRDHASRARIATFLALALTLVVGPALALAASPPSCCTVQCADGYCPLELEHPQAQDEAQDEARDPSVASTDDVHASCHETGDGSAPGIASEVSSAPAAAQGARSSGVGQQSAPGSHGQSIRGPIKGCSELSTGVSTSTFVLTQHGTPTVTLAAFESSIETLALEPHGDGYRTLGARGPPAPVRA